MTALDNGLDAASWICGQGPANADGALLIYENPRLAMQLRVPCRSIGMRLVTKDERDQEKSESELETERAREARIGVISSP